MEIFISYSTLDKDLAGKTKSWLESVSGLEAFLAHEAIEPSREWIDEIRRQLGECHVFIPILTLNFNKSDWTNQEVGFAMAAERLIIPLKFSANPCGFMSRFQALDVGDETHIGRACSQVGQIIATRPIVGDLLRNAVIRRFGQSNSWEEADSEADNLLRYESSYTPDQIADIIRCVIDNRQIHGSFRAQPKLRRLVNNHKEHIASELYSEFYQAIRP